MIEGLIVLLLKLDEVVVLRQVATGDDELEQLSGEVLSVIVLLRHLHDEIFTSEVNLRLHTILSIAQLVNFYPGVLFSLDSNNLSILDSKRNGQ